jgi:hypothetical protein
VRTIQAVCLLLACVMKMPAADRFADSLIAAFDVNDIVALGEWHGSEQDAELRLRLIRHPEFPTKVGHVVIEAGSARHLDVLDRFIAGDDIPREMVRAVWRDITTPGGADSPVYEALLVEFRRLNATLPASRKIRVIAADPPIDWHRIRSRSEWREIAGGRDSYAAGLLERAIVAKERKALLICGSAHLWQRNQIVKEPNVAALLKQRHPGKLYTVSRLRPSEETGKKLVSVIPAEAPVLLDLRRHEAGELNPNDLLGVPVPMFAPDTKLRDVVDAVIWAGGSEQAKAASPPQEPEYEAEKQRRLKLLQAR